MAIVDTIEIALNKGIHVIETSTLGCVPSAPHVTETNIYLD